MTEKRYFYKINNNGALIIIDKTENILIRDMYRACDLLNDQHKEIEELKSENKELIELIRHCYENWSEEKKKMVGEISNGLLGE